MLMLKKSELDINLFNMASMDAATSGSETQILINVQEAANTLDPWEDVYSSSMVSLSEYGLNIDSETATQYLKPLYQELRHGLAFDWVINYVVASIAKVYPFSRHFEFKGTAAFMHTFTDDPVFEAEIKQLDAHVATLLDWALMGYPERLVYSRLSKFAGTEDLMEAVVYADNNTELEGVEPFLFPTLTAGRTQYLVFLMEMLSRSIGTAKRTYWTDRVMDIKAGITPDMVIVTGCKFQAFAYGSLGNAQPKWHNLDKGIRLLSISERSQRSEYIRAVPDEMTFFRITNGTLFVDETLFPKVAFFGNWGDAWTPWVTVNDFRDTLDVPLDKMLGMRIKYDFPYKEGVVKTIKIKGKLNCIVKDATVILDSNNCGETKVVFRGSSTGFKISDADKKFPFTVFNSSRVKSDTTFDWSGESN